MIYQYSEVDVVIYHCPGVDVLIYHYPVVVVIHHHPGVYMMIYHHPGVDVVIYLPRYCRRVDLQQFDLHATLTTSRMPFTSASVR